MKTENDKMVVYSNFAGDATVSVYIIALFYVLNFIIGIVGMYSLSAGLHKLTAFFKGRSILLTIDQVDDLYWAAVVVCGVANVVITTLDVYFHSEEFIRVNLPVTAIFGLFPSSGLVLSLVAPTIVFIITLKLKRQLGSFFKPPGEVTTDIENPHKGLPST